MATVRPFQGLRYNNQKIGMSQVIAPPYDVISEKEREDLYHLSEYNVVRLILGKDTPADNESENRYTRARKFLNNWLQEGVLVKESKPAFYIYEQVFQHPETKEKKIRHALFSLLKLEDFGAGVVFPHEKTYSKPKADRLKLLTETHTNLSPVFGLYDDGQKKISQLLASHYAKSPLFEAEDREGVIQRVWKIEDENSISAIMKAFEGKKIVLADGHHRYETALNHRNEKKLAGKPSSACDYTLICLVELEDSGLLVLPTHRLVKRPAGFSKGVFVEMLSLYFDLKQVTKEELFKQVNGLSAQDKGFGVYVGDGESYLAKLRSFKEIEALIPKGRSREWAELEVSLLSYVVLAKVLGLEEEHFEDFLAYTKSEKEALEKVDSGAYGVGFLLRSIPVQAIQKVCEGKELLPHKSTYFYPKLASGLVFYQHE